jgi:hypothetical protein
MCPKCKNIDWKQTKFEKKPVLTYGAEKIRTHKSEIIYRYKRCLQCGHKWITIEQYHEDVLPPGEKLKGKSTLGN